LSALTKIAVVLLVIASLLLSAGTIVFVNKVDQYQTFVDEAKAETNREKANAQTARTAASAREQELITQAQAANNRESALSKQVGDQAGQILQLSAQVTKADQEKKAAEVNAQVIAAALKASQDQNTAYQSQVADLRKFRDTLVEERHSLNTQLTDALSKVAALETARKGAEEKAVGFEGRYNELATRVRSAFPNLNLEKLDDLPQRVPAGPPLEGVVTSRFSAGGKPWASISLGSKDNVAKGMRFNVHNDQEFLGYLTIQSVEPTEAVGVLEGKAPEKVKVQDQVRTQLQ
jgi:hypothetical protein